ncbi:MAG TPA: TolC family protein [Negativicutes bacterium]|nr:TolC family protein [Negativicutes bacterium]
MKKKYKRMVSLLLALAMILSSTAVSAADGDSYTIESAVAEGLENSILLQQLDDKITLSELKYRAYRDITSDLDEGQDELRSGEETAETSFGTIVVSQELLNSAKTDISEGYYPEGFPDYTVIKETQLPGGYSLPAFIVTSDSGSDDRRTVKEQFEEYWSANGVLLTLTGKTEDGFVSGADDMLSALKKTVKDQQKALDEWKVKYEEGLLTLVDGKIDYAVAKANISSSLAKQLDMSELNELTVSDDRKLMLKMAKSLATLTYTSKGIFRNQIALQIQNSYYNVLKAKKLVEVKKSTVDRAETQYRFSNDSYQAGMKAKDSMLLSELFLTGSKLEYQKAQSEYENAMTELKKNMNIPMEKDIKLDEAGIDEKLAVDLGEGLELGLEGRLEILKAREQLDIYNMNLELVDKRYNNKDTQYKEALRLKNIALLELERTEREVESSIRQSYNTMKTMEEMLEEAAGMVDQAKECVDIAQSKYEEGYGADSALLDRLGLAASSGTILEVISAEENLTQVQEKYIQILYGYNLAKAKYLNDIAYLTY